MKTNLLNKQIAKACYHCGDTCNELFLENGHVFCCAGCRQVYLLLSENDLCNYYDIENSPGLKAQGKYKGNRFAYLDDDETIDQLVQFRSRELINVTFSLPQMHCSSCVFLLENLHKIEEGVFQSQTHFEKKEIFISFNPAALSMRKLVELLSFIGYEPAISLNDTQPKLQKKINVQKIAELGVAGFCFSNIMMLSFPEYFSDGNITEAGLKETFSWIIFALSVPVLLYSARSIFISAFKSLRQGILNIDAPIALAIVITFARSYYEIISGTGSGYLDSGSGIIFFMLIGRWFQAKTYDAISFDRQYKSYFPLGVTVLKGFKEENIPVTRLQKEDIIIIRNEEMIPADAVLLEGEANIDYSFVSGEDVPVKKHEKDLVYAGGKQKGGAIQLRVIKEPSQSYITQLWNNDVFGKTKNTEQSFIHPWSRYFTIILLSIAGLSAVYWFYTDASKILSVVTAVLIVACPCSLLLSATFTFGNMLRIFGKNKLYLKNATVIESLASIQHIIFDKTGTITEAGKSVMQFNGLALTHNEESCVRFAAKQSAHTLSQSLAAMPGVDEPGMVLNDFIETTGKGVAADVDGIPVRLGAAGFTAAPDMDNNPSGSRVYVNINSEYKGFYEMNNSYRQGISEMAKSLADKNYNLHILSGDNDAEQKNLLKIFGPHTSLSFKVSPVEKLAYIKSLQENTGQKVLMLGDGLNDAGALMQADTGIAVSDNAARFSPACDAIMDGSVLHKLPAFIAYAKAGKQIVMASFILSILYNIAGISFAVQAKLSPMIAAILMPASSISIVLLVALLTGWVAKHKNL